MPEIHTGPVIELREARATIAKLQAVLKDIAYSGIHMTVGEIRERALDAIKEAE
jgi:hypothetical protein